MPRIAAFFVTCVSEDCDQYGPCGDEYCRVSVECLETWIDDDTDTVLSHFAVTGWDGPGDAPTWKSLSRRDRMFAMDALAGVANADVARREWVQHLPYVMEGVGVAS